MLAVAIVLAVMLALALGEIARREAQSRRGSDAPLAPGANRSQLDATLALRDAIMEASPTPVLLFDSSARLVRTNLAAREAIPDLEIGATVALQRVATAVHDALAGRQQRPFEVTVYEPERRRFHAHLRTYRDHGARSCAVVLADESAEADYRDARRLFSAGVSHELRTPLARMLALVDTLSLGLDEEERDALLDQVRMEIDAMRQLIEDMMLLTRLESEGIGEGELVELADAVAGCVQRQADAAAAVGIELDGTVAPGVIAVMPRRLVDVVLDNLVENAIRHAGAGSRVTVTARGLAGAVELAVSDTGAGIPAEHLGRVFERFHRVEGSRTGPGTGLGLAIVKHIAEARRGRASIESTEGVGTTVRVVLPGPEAMAPAE
ncbi:MAG: two-component system, OmpR family, phosphate regulon sensor histidine kinase PhoR [Gaiellales bacterium]|jgi:two-component system phosphate regulon sensor histidine kinase PhoR|nr:two-component system, OmpR family, phosphate regulon sensor histidine kinase PhoR [Gaiellales bacterium]